MPNRTGLFIALVTCSVTLAGCGAGHVKPPAASVKAGDPAPEVIAPPSPVVIAPPSPDVIAPPSPDVIAPPSPSGAAELPMEGRVISQDGRVKGYAYDPVDLDSKVTVQLILDGKPLAEQVAGRVDERRYLAPPGHAFDFAVPGQTEGTTVSVMATSKRGRTRLIGTTQLHYAKDSKEQQGLGTKHVLIGTAEPDQPLAGLDGVTSKAIQLAVNGTFSFMLSGNPSVGYGWNRPVITVESVVDVSSQAVGPLAEGTGGGSTSLYTVRGLKAGSTSLSLEHWSRFDKPGTPKETKTFDITVVSGEGAGALAAIENPGRDQTVYAVTPDTVSIVKSHLGKTVELQGRYTINPGVEAGSVQALSVSPAK